MGNKGMQVELRMLGNFGIFFVIRGFFFKSSEIISECKTDWIQIRPMILSGLNRIQAFCKGIRTGETIYLFVNAHPIEFQYYWEKCKFQSNHVFTNAHGIEINCSTWRKCKFQSIYLFVNYHPTVIVCITWGQRSFNLLCLCLSHQQLRSYGDRTTA